MKTLLTAIIAVGISGAALAQNEVPEDTIPGYTVQLMPASAQRAAVVDSDNRSEPLAFTQPGFGVTASTGRVYSETEIGGATFDYLGFAFEGNQ